MDFWNWILSSIEIIPLSIGLIIAVVSIYSYRKTEKLKATLNMTHHIITSPLANEGVNIYDLSNTRIMMKLVNF